MTATKVPTPTRKAGLDRLSAFLPNSGRHYAANRNADLGPNDRSNVSVLSPYIRHRLIAETEVLDAVLGRFAYATAEKFVQEVFWRTYFKGFLEQRPSIWHDYVSERDRLLGEASGRGGIGDGYRAACEARTGIACFDAWARELAATGYLHNHTRMWFASIWIFTLKLPWQLGADVFMRHLMDGDAASNTLSWRWVGGLHTKGKTYLARADNIERYTNGRFSPHGQLAGVAPPLEETATHPKRAIPAADDVASVGAPYVLLVTDEDCAPETLGLKRRPEAVICLSSAADRTPGVLGRPAKAFNDGTLGDAAERAAEALGADATVKDGEGDWGAILGEAARAASATDIVTAYTPVGPGADRLAAARAWLKDEGSAIRHIRRSLDELAWPHATRGFFALKSRIPDILEDLARQAEPRLL